MDKRLENVINIIRSLNESMGVAAMGGPTNNVGDGKIAGAVPGEASSSKKKEEEIHLRRQRIEEILVKVKCLAMPRLRF